MRISTIKQTINRIFKNKAVLIAVALLFWLGVWQIFSTVVGEELLFPTPLSTATEMGRLFITPSFWLSAGLTMLRIVGGFVLGAIVGALLAVITTRFRAANILLAPLLQIVRSAPVASFIILAMLWIGRSFLPVFISFLMVVPVVWGNVQKGIQQTDRGLLEMARVYRLGRWDTLVKVWFPSVAPYLLASLTTSLGFAWKSGIAAEVLCLPRESIGKLLQDAKLYLETPQVFALTVVIILFSLLLEWLLSLAATRMGRRFNLR